MSAVAPPRPTVAAFFDLDNTLVQAPRFFHLARSLGRAPFP